MIKLADSKLLRIIPPNLQDDPDMIAACQLSDDNTHKILDLIKNVVFIGNIDKLESCVLDNLSWQFNVDFYEPDLDIDVKRGLIKNAIRFKMAKGTPGAIEDLLKVVFDYSRVIEWFAYGGEPFTFKIMTTDRVVDVGALKNIRRAVDTVKNTRSHLTEFQVERDNLFNENVCCVFQVRRTVEIEVSEEA